MFDKSTRSKQVCQLLLSLIVGVKTCAGEYCGSRYQKLLKDQVR